MLAYTLEIAKRGDKGITNWGTFQGLQVGATGITNMGTLRDFRSRQKDYKSGQRFLIETKKLQIGASEIVV